MQALLCQPPLFNAFSCEVLLCSMKCHHSTPPSEINQLATSTPSGFKKKENAPLCVYFIYRLVGKVEDKRPPHVPCASSTAHSKRPDRLWERAGKKVNKDVSPVPGRQPRHFAKAGVWNRSLPHAAQEYFWILITHLVCRCHMAFISIPSTQWGVKGPDAVSSSLPHTFSFFLPVVSASGVSLLIRSVIRCLVFINWADEFKCGLITRQVDPADERGHVV